MSLIIFTVIIRLPRFLRQIRLRMDYYKLVSIDAEHSTPGNAFCLFELELIWEAGVIPTIAWQDQNSNPKNSKKSGIARMRAHHYNTRLFHLDTASVSCQLFATFVLFSDGFSLVVCCIECYCSHRRFVFTRRPVFATLSAPGSCGYWLWKKRRIA